MMNRNELEALAYDEAIRLKETYFDHHHPYTCWMEIPAEVSFVDEDEFYWLVQVELERQGEKITRNGKFFKIDRFQNHK